MHKPLEQQRAEDDAIKRLNSIAELGEVLGQDLAGRHQQLLEATQPCLTLDPVALDNGPECPKCHLKSTDKPPSQAHDQFTEDLNATLEAQQRRLSAEAIRQILARSEDDRVIRFLQIVQAADLSSLANVLDDSLVDFLRQLLSGTHVNAPKIVYTRQVAEPTAPYEQDFTFSPDPTVLRQLMDSFDTVGDEEVELVAKELAKLLHKALNEEKRRQPGRRVRIRLR
jgi:hypothetical protein